MLLGEITNRYRALVKYIRSRCHDAVSNIMFMVVFIYNISAPSWITEMGNQICSICSYKMQTAILQFFLNVWKENRFVPSYRFTSIVNYTHASSPSMTIDRSHHFCRGKTSDEISEKVLMGKLKL